MTLKRDRSRRGSWWTLARRRWLYGVLAAIITLLVTYGAMTTDQAAAWLVVGAAALGITGVALKHPTK